MSSPDLQLGRGETAPVRQRSHDRPASLDNPRSPRRRAGMPRVLRALVHQLQAQR